MLRAVIGGDGVGIMSDGNGSAHESLLLSLIVVHVCVGVIIKFDGRGVILFFANHFWWLRVCAKVSVFHYM